MCFNYRKLVEQAFGIAKATRPDYKICIIGAGVTGLTAARELLRCGFNNVTLVEQSHRIGGRHLSVLNAGQSPLLGQTPFEMGAMRMPMFNRADESPLEGQSLLAYYCKLFDLRLSDFPNPGTKYANGVVVDMPYPTDDVRLLTQAAVGALDRIFRPGFKYSKAEVMLLNLCQPGEYTDDLFAISQPAEANRVMTVMDQINERWGRGTLRSACVPTNPFWGMRRDMMSQSYTTKLDQLWSVACR